jgi:biopolymer transport protein ExbB
MFIRKLALACSISGYAICSLLAACTYDAPSAGSGGSGGAGGGAGMGGSGGESAPWWNPAWKKRVRITFQNAPGEHLNDFPVMIRLNPERIGDTVASSTGADLRFLDDDGTTILDHEVEQWKPGEDAYVWVRVPRIDATNTDHIWLYYDNLDAPDEAKTKEVWVDFLGVYHLAPTAISPNDFPDSTQNQNGAWETNIAGNLPNPIVPGVIGRAATLDSMRYIHLGLNDEVAADVGEARTAEAWIFATKIQDQAIVYEEGECVGWFLGTTMNGEYLGNFITDSEGEPCGPGIKEYQAKAIPVETGSWHYLTLVVDRPNETMSLYVDGKLGNSVAIDNVHLADGNGVFRIGSDHDGGAGTFDGIIDEVRVSSIARSPAWIAAQHRSMKDNFVVFTTE